MACQPTLKELLVGFLIPKEKYEEIFFLGFCFRTHKRTFLGVNKFVLTFFSSVLALKTVDAQMLFWQIFLKMN